MSITYIFKKVILLLNTKLSLKCETFFFFFLSVLNRDGEQLVSVIFMTISIYLNSVDKLSLLFSFIPAFLTFLQRSCFSFQKSFLLPFSGLREFRPQLDRKIKELLAVLVMTLLLVFPCDTDCNMSWHHINYC